jgi:hypothetical protein
MVDITNYFHRGLATNIGQLGTTGHHHKGTRSWRCNDGKATGHGDIGMKHVAIAIKTHL